jgi:cytochrome c-type biogenesis protein CcmF
MQVNDSISLAGYQFTLLEVYPLKGANFGGEAAEIAVHNSKGQLIAQLHAEKRLYTIQRMVMTEAAVHGRLSRDLYVSLGEALPGDAWAVRLYVKPFVRWVWLGGLLMALGAFVALLDKRYRRKIIPSAPVKATELANA